MMRTELLALAAELAARGERFALATVVRREPPSSARVGDTALVTHSGEVHGWVGGGCTRSTLMREALRAIADGEPRFLRLSPDPTPAPQPGVVALPMTCKSGGTVELYVEAVVPPPRVLIFGSTPAAHMLARIADALGYRVDVVDPDADRAAFPAAVRLHSGVTSEALPAGAHVLVATMDERDVAAVQRALALAPPYLGVIASRKRFAELRRTLAESGIAESALDAIVAPAGLDIGARTPEEIAISVMAQMVERMRRGAAVGRGNPLVAPRDEPREAIDPVCGMAVAIAGARHHAEVEGVAYYFCCDGCRATFIADPARFAARNEPAPGP